MSQADARMIRDPTVWHCPNCDNTITTLIPIIQPPMCSNHLGAARTMKGEQWTNSQQIPPDVTDGADIS